MRKNLGGWHWYEVELRVSEFNLFHWTNTDGEKESRKKPFPILN